MKILSLISTHTESKASLLLEKSCSRMSVRAKRKSEKVSFTCELHAMVSATRSGRSRSVPTRDIGLEFASLVACDVCV